MKKSLSLIAVFIGLVIICFSSFKNFPDKEDTWLPKNFDPKQGILLIQKVQWPQRQQRLIEEFMEKNYPYKYEFISIKDVKDVDAKYGDSSTYPFVILYTYTTHKMHENEFRPESEKILVGMFDFHFYDQTTNVEYPATGRGASWASMPFKDMMNRILEKFK